MEEKVFWKKQKVFFFGWTKETRRNVFEKEKRQKIAESKAGFLALCPVFQADMANIKNSIFS